MSEIQGNGLSTKWIGIVAVLFGILLLANHGNEFLKQLVVAPGSVAELGVPADCRADELEEEGLSLLECELMVSNIQITLASSPDWFRSALLALSFGGILFALLSIAVGMSFVNRTSPIGKLAGVCFAGLVAIDLLIFIAATNTGPLLRAQYLWSTLLWFFVHLSLLSAVFSVSKQPNLDSD
ncbi:MAG: hypothetical protein GKR91_17140 [Pseudomonadales bacterium]|nr:hypothetical protein [Pseudomonadales bacterium]